MKTEVVFIIFAVALIGGYVSLFDDLQSIKAQYSIYFAILAAFSFPMLVFFRKWKSKDQIGKEKKLSKEERELFSKIEAPPTKDRHVWPVGYSGYNAEESTNEIIDRFIEPKNYDSNEGKFAPAPKGVKTPSSFASDDGEDPKKD